MNVFRTDGTVSTVAAGTKAVTGLNSNTAYQFYPYYSEANNDIEWVDSSVTFPNQTGVAFGTNKYVSTTSTFATTGTWSVAFWAKIPDSTTQGWLSLGNPSSNGAATAVGIQIYGNAGTENIFLSVKGASSFTTQTVTNANLNDGNWHFIVVTFNGINTFDIYLDGLIVQTLGVTPAGTGFIWHLGMTQGISGAGLTANTYMSGTLSRVAYLNTILNSVSVGQLFQAGLNAGAASFDAAILAQSGIVNYWKLIETSGTVAADSAGSNTGTYTGSPTLNQSSEIYNPIGSPAIAWTFPSFGAAQAQSNIRRVALSSGALGASTPITGSAGGSGGGTPGTIAGGGCFSPDTKVKTSAGAVRFDKLRVGDLVLTANGTYRPILQVHQHNWTDDLLQMPGGLVTKLHPVLSEGKWVRAHQVFTETVPFKGVVWNLTIDTEDPTFEEIQLDSPTTEHSFVLENGHVAHNAGAVGK
jgi:hypothetical protein